jgi:hypothetical protein
MSTATEYPPIPEDFKLYFYTLGDINKDGKIDNADMALLQKAYGEPDTEADINGDGIVDLHDLFIITKNFGKDITTEWHRTVDKTRAEEKAATPENPVVPWYIEWARELAKLQASNDQAYSQWQDPAMQSFMDSLKVMAQMPDLFWKGNVENADAMLDAQIAANTRVSTKTINDALSETPSEDYTDTYGLSEALGKKLATDLGMPMGLLPVERYKEVKNGADTLIQMQKDILAGKLKGYVLSSVVKTLSADQVTFQDTVINMVSQAYGWDQIGSLASTLPLQAGVIEPAKQYYNRLYLPYIPGVGDLVRMYAAGKITDADYSETMALLGYDEFWQAKYWEAHWTQPTVQDALTAWRRGKIDDDELNKIMQHADLDPEWQAIWEDRKFNDMPVGMAHMLYDIGLIDDAKVFDVVKRNGFFLDDAALIAESIKQFPIRRIKLRALLALATAAGTGALTPLQMLFFVGKLGYDAKLVPWLELYGQLKMAISGSKVAKAPKEKLLSLGDLKAAYLRGLLTEDVFRTELLTRNYGLDEVQILLQLMVDKQTVEQAGGKMYALSVIELLNAWRYEVITEDDLRNKLLARGLPLDELDVLIATKKLQWKITPSVPGVGGV